MTTDTITTTQPTGRALTNELDRVRTVAYQAALLASKPCATRIAEYCLRQNGLLLLQQIEAATKALDKIGGELRGNMMHQLLAGEVVEDGALTATVEECVRRTPGWKDEALKLAAEVAALRGQTFDPEAFVAALQAATEPTTSRKVKVISRD